MNRLSAPEIRENAPRNNLTIAFNEWTPEHYAACNACWLYKDDLNLDCGRFEKCLCVKKACPLVWCSKPDPKGPEESCAELRYLHEKMNISEEIMFGLSEPGEPTEEILIARYLMHHIGESLPRCPLCENPMVVRTEESTGEDFLGCSKYPACEHSEELPEDQQMRRMGAPEFPGLQQ